MALVYNIKKSHHYTKGYLVSFHIDYSTIRYLANKLVSNGRVTCWLLLLQEFDVTLKG